MLHVLIRSVHLDRPGKPSALTLHKYPHGVPAVPHDPLHVVPQVREELVVRVRCQFLDAFKCTASFEDHDRAVQVPVHRDRDRTDPAFFFIRVLSHSSLFHAVLSPPFEVHDARERLSSHRTWQRQLPAPQSLRSGQAGGARGAHGPPPTSNPTDPLLALPADSSAAYRTTRPPLFGGVGWVWKNLFRI